MKPITLAYGLFSPVFSHSSLKTFNTSVWWSLLWNKMPKAGSRSCASSFCFLCSHHLLKTSLIQWLLGVETCTVNTFDLKCAKRQQTSEIDSKNPDLKSLCTQEPHFKPTKVHLIPAELFCLKCLEPEEMCWKFLPPSGVIFIKTGANSSDFTWCKDFHTAACCRETVASVSVLSPHEELKKSKESIRVRGCRGAGLDQIQDFKALQWRSSPSFYSSPN